jgi:hypothetical protein
LTESRRGVLAAGDQHPPIRQQRRHLPDTRGAHRPDPSEEKYEPDAAHAPDAPTNPSTTNTINTHPAKRRAAHALIP